MLLTPEALKTALENHGWTVSSVGRNDEESDPAAIAYCSDPVGKHYAVYAFQTEYPKVISARVEILVDQPEVHNDDDDEVVSCDEADRWTDALNTAIDEL